MRRTLMCACLAVAALVGCDVDWDWDDDEDGGIPQPMIDEGPLERAGRAADHGLDRLGDELREEGAELRDDLEHAGDWIERKTDRPGEPD